MPQASESRSTLSLARPLLAALFLEIGLPFIVYFGTELLGASAYVSLLAAASSAALRTVWVMVRRRRIDPVSLVLTVMFGGGLALTYLTGDPRLLLAKESAMSFIVGVALLVSCLIGRPLVYYVARRIAQQVGGEAQRMFEANENTAQMRTRLTQVSLMWGAGLVLHSLTVVYLAYTLPFDHAANLSRWTTIGMYVALTGWTVRGLRRYRRTAA